MHCVVHCVAHCGLSGLSVCSIAVASTAILVVTYSADTTASEFHTQWHVTEIFSSIMKERSYSLFLLLCGEVVTKAMHCVASYKKWWLLLQHWFKHNKAGGKPWPEERAGHASCCLNHGQQHPQVLVTGGENMLYKVLGDAWILDVESGWWRKARMCSHTL